MEAKLAAAASTSPAAEEAGRGPSATIASPSASGQRGHAVARAPTHSGAVKHSHLLRSLASEPTALAPRDGGPPTSCVESEGGKLVARNAQTAGDADPGLRAKRYGQRGRR